PLPVSLAGGPTFELDLGSGDRLQSLANVAFAATESTDASGAVRTLSFVGQDPRGLTVRETWRVRPNDYALDLEVEIRGLPAGRPEDESSLTPRSWPLPPEANQLADERALRASSLVGTNIRREYPRSLTRGPRSLDGNARWSVVQTRYFLAAVAITQGTPR